MKKNQRIKIYLSCIIMLFFIAYTLEQTLEVKQTKLEEITLKNINQIIKTNALVSQQTIIKNNSFITLKNNKTTIQAVFFKLNQTLEKNKEYILIGKVTPYKNKPQINIIELKLK